MLWKFSAVGGRLPRRWAFGLKVKDVSPGGVRVTDTAEGESVNKMHSVPGRKACAFQTETRQSKGGPCTEPGGQVGSSRTLPAPPPQVASLPEEQLQIASSLVMLGPKGLEGSALA